MTKLEELLAYIKNLNEAEAELALDWMKRLTDLSENQRSYSALLLDELFRKEDAQKVVVY